MNHNKTKEERHPDLAKEQVDRLDAIQVEIRAKRRVDDKAKWLEETKKAKEKEMRLYDRIIHNMIVIKR